MKFSPRIALWGRLFFWILVAVTSVSVGLLSTRIDLSPRVESDFFFSTDDPALQSSRAIEELFPSSPRIVLAAISEDPHSKDTIARVAGLTKDLRSLSGVSSVLSLTSGPQSPSTVVDSPLWSRILLGDTPNASYLLVESEGPATSGLITSIEEVLEDHRRPGFELAASGVPYVVEQIRRALGRDLRVFSSAALIVFGLVILVVYRSAALVLGTLLTCSAASLVSLTLLSLLGIPIGLLTANLATIVFVLTLSHTVFLTSNWRHLQARTSRDEDDSWGEATLHEALRITFVASFWCLVAALLGFGSLLFATAKPLRDLGVSGAVGTLVAIIMAYGLYPAFLRRGRRRSVDATHLSTPTARTVFRMPSPRWVLPSAALALFASFGLSRLDTDPSLLDYFAPDREPGRGLSTIDAGIGSSPLYLVVGPPEGETLDSPAAGVALQSLQRELDADPDVGTALTAAVIVEEAKLNPLALMLSWRRVLQLLESERFDGIAHRFVTPDRKHAFIALSMHEGSRNDRRQAVLGRLRARVDGAGLQTEHVGGLYQLQGTLSDLVGSSLRKELGGLLLCFLVVAWILSRTLRVALAMTLCLASIPWILLGTLGYLGRPLDIISTPAVNVAIALGIDAMIHLAAAVRRFRATGSSVVESWSEARQQQRPAILGAMAILAAGFAIFALSSFPPTRVFGGLVTVGLLLSAFFALQVLPTLASWLPRNSSSAGTTT
ncbi:MAG: MMPL family transporter [Thermoanaerobaculia bacterium]|nr:MMPL family transporter [Thermoanaerobaculia bacterium]